MRKRAIGIILIVMAALIVVSIAAGCTPSEGAAERIEIETTHIYLSPTGDASTYKLEPRVYPTETASQGVHYSLRDNSDRRYLLVGTDGTLTARGEVKQDEEGNVQDIIVVITSDQSSDVYVEVTVTIEEVAVEQIIFSENVVVVELHSGGVQLNPQFRPSHASIGRNVEYSSDDTSIATVDSSGFVTPRGIGKVAIWVRTPRQGAFDTQVETHVTIDVRYSALNYRMELITDESAMRQIAGSPETLQFNLIQLDSISDPEPEIVWYVNTFPIEDGVSRGSKILNYTPSTLPPGEYVIRAELSNGTQRQVLESDPLIIYSPLESISLDVIGGGENYDYLVGDSARFLVTYTSGQYPPEQYRWTVTHTDEDGGVTSETFNRAPAVQTGGADVISDLTYIFEETGTYSFTAEAVVKSVASGVVSESVTVVVGAGGSENDIYGVTVEGTPEGMVKVLWDALPYESDYYIEINVNGAIVSLNSVLNAEYFGRNHAVIPDDMANFAESFAVRVRGSRYDNWTDWVNYEAGTFTPSHYEYFAEVAGGFDGYISDVEELGDIINYISLFRPAELVDATASGENTWYSVDLFIPFDFEDLPAEFYTFDDAVLDPDSISGYSEDQRDAYHIMVAAVYGYVESVSLGIRVTSADRAGRVTYSVAVLSDLSPVGMYEPDNTDGRYPDVENALTNYSSDPRGTGAALPIESLEYTLEVSTSNQLYYAAINGYRPLPAQGSAAERIYNKAKEVLNSIIGNGMSDIDKALAIYDWIAVNVSYDNLAAAATGVAGIGSYNAFYLEGVFDDGTAVCDGIAKAYALMCSMEGIHSYKIMGVTRNIPAVGHTWNALVIDGRCFYVDPTWANMTIQVGNDNYETIDHEYFLLSYDDAAAARLFYGTHYATPTDSRLYAYEISTGEGTDLTIGSVEELAAAFEFVTSRMPGNAWFSVALDNEFTTSLGGTQGVIDEAHDIAREMGISIASSLISRGTLVKLILHITFSV